MQIKVVSNYVVPCASSEFACGKRKKIEKLNVGIEPAPK